MPWREKSRTQSDAAPGRACETQSDALEREVEACPVCLSRPINILGQFWYKKRDGA